MCVCVLSLVWLFVTPWTVAHQAPLSMRLPKQEYWSGLTFPTVGDQTQVSHIVGRFFTIRTTKEAHF